VCIDSFDQLCGRRGPYGIPDGYRWRRARFCRRPAEHAEDRLGLRREACPAERRDERHVVVAEIYLQRSIAGPSEGPLHQDIRMVTIGGIDLGENVA
jgi:hypothetical protein